MKAKNLLIVLTLAMSIPTQSLADDGFEIPAQVFTVPAGALIGYVAGWSLEYFGVQKVTSMPYVKRVFELSTPCQRAVLNSHLKELGALVGALIATGNTKNIALLFEVNFVIDMVKRLKDRDFSTESIIHLVVDAAAVYGLETQFHTSSRH